ncbi:hypothetical protein KMW28_21780 [Flammeovirga yaeyamensis]|uniref:Uncharacterized protein n=1 Tax=Flammeovirga yaeyamensis TaxID=367791 RepID=A0AAX1NCW4_9BACT|nr:hypothetical protein [Flammeovirga yaeyamensis]MBB3697014.1 hypothetical protein [Flammeovirga yaeyamensis]NMF33677.1 hypothetical protein [Flammeovirga yaeyamensis]QWG05057.1 hypothetical protein KMW28_21780 [Flammeovirga yaeyamensis]
MKKATTFIFLLVVSIFLMNFSEQSPIEKLVAKINQQRKLLAKEVLYIHTDKPYYMAGESIYYKVYLREASRFLPQQLSKTVYVEWINPKSEIVSKQVIHLDKEHNHGDIKLSTELAQGEYLLRAYTNWMRNYGTDYFFEQKVNVFQIDIEQRRVAEEKNVNDSSSEINDGQHYNQEFDLQFFAESGKMMANIPNKVGFKLLNESGYGQDFTATVFNQNDEKVQEIKSDYLGMGSLYLSPKNNEKYYAVLNKDLHKQHPTKYDLPKVETQTTVLKINNIKPEIWRAQIISNDNQLAEGVHLMMSQRGEVLNTWSIASKNVTAFIKIPTDRIKNGVVRFTLLNKDLLPIVERKSFKYIPQNLSISMDKPMYKKRDKATVTLDLKDSDSTGISGVSSISIVDKNLIDMDTKTKTLESSWLFQNEIKGNIEQPKSYFADYSLEKSNWLDNLMLTQGYEQPVWLDHLDDSLKMEFLPERGISIMGRTTKVLNKEKVRVSEITMTSLNGERSYAEQVVTDDLGKFMFTGMVFYDTTDFVFSAKKFNTKKGRTTENKNVDISLYGVDSPIIYPFSSTVKEETINALSAYEKEVLDIEKINRAFDSKTIILDEVEISELAENDPFDRPGKLHTDVLSKVIIDSMNYEGMTVWQMLQYNPRASMMLRRYGIGSNGGVADIDEAGIITDFNDFPVILDNFTADIVMLKSMMASEIEYFEVLSPADAALYVYGAENGIIALWSKTGGSSPNYTVYGINSIKHPGYYVGKEYYTPKYDVQSDDHRKPDHRITLEWFPNVEIDSIGTGTVEFFTDDKASDYLIEVEGIDQRGEPYYEVKTFKNN